MTNEERIETLQEARIFALAAPTLLVLIAKKRQIALEIMMREFREGRTEHAARVAELTCLGDLEREIRSKEALYETMSTEMKK